MSREAARVCGAAVAVVAEEESLFLASDLAVVAHDEVLLLLLLVLAVGGGGGGVDGGLGDEFARDLLLGRLRARARSLSLSSLSRARVVWSAVATRLERQTSTRARALFERDLSDIIPPREEKRVPEKQKKRARWRC